MALSILELASAREMVRSLLEQLRLEAYLFEVEPHARNWKIRVDCGINEKWQSMVLEISSEQLTASREDGPARDALLAAWHDQLGACARGAAR
jgi:hypothetical protein